MKTKISASSYFFGVLFLGLTIAFLLLCSFTPKYHIVKKEVTTNAFSQLLSCSQSDLFICNYITIQDYVDALVAELNNQLNYCGGALAACNSSNCCYNTSNITFTSALSSGKNPYFYCTNESCNSFTCSTLSGGGSQQNNLSVADQNEILSIMRSSAVTTGNTICSGGSYGPISGYRVYKTPVRGSCSSDGPSCFNFSIKMEVTYLCSCTN